MTDTLVAGNDLYIGWDDPLAGDAVTNHVVTVRLIGGADVYASPTGSATSEEVITGATTATWAIGSYEVTVTAVNVNGEGPEMLAIPLDISGVELHATSAPADDEATTDTTHCAWTWNAATGATGYIPYVLDEAINQHLDPLCTAIATDANVGWTLSEAHKAHGWTMNGDGSITHAPAAYANPIRQNCATIGKIGVESFHLAITDGSLTVVSGFGDSLITGGTYTVADNNTDIRSVFDGILFGSVKLIPSADLACTISAIKYMDTLVQAEQATAAFVYAVPESATPIELLLAYKATDGTNFTELSDFGASTSDASVAAAIITGNYAYTYVPYNTATVIDVLANDEGSGAGYVAPLVVGALDAASVEGGTLVNNGSNVTYTPPTNHEGFDLLHYTPHDSDTPANEGLTTSHLLIIQSPTRTVTIAAIDPPTVLAGETYTDTLTAAHTNDDAVTWSIECAGIPNASISYTAGDPADKSATLNIPTDIDLTPGEYEATVTVTDAYDNSDSQIITITVSGVTAIDPPVAGDVEVNTPAGFGYALIDVIAASTDPGALSMTIYTVNEAQCLDGDTIYTPQGSITNTLDVLYFYPDADFVGTKTLTYRVSNGTRQSEPGTITVNVITPTYCGSHEALNRILRRTLF